MILALHMLRLAGSASVQTQTIANEGRQRKSVFSTYPTKIYALPCKYIGLALLTRSQQSC